MYVVAPPMLTCYFSTGGFVFKFPIANLFTQQVAVHGGLYDVKIRAF